jgi:hypothetical protein
VAQRDRPAVDVDPGGIEAGGLDDGEGLAGEGLVQLDEVEVGRLQARPHERLGDRLHRADAHDLGRHSGHRVGHEPGDGLDAQAAGALP